MTSSPSLQIYFVLSEKPVIILIWHPPHLISWYLCTFQSEFEQLFSSFFFLQFGLCVCVYIWIVLHYITSRPCSNTESPFVELKKKIVNMSKMFICTFYIPTSYYNTYDTKLGDSESFSSSTCPHWIWSFFHLFL